ncbi:MAG TPA: tetratricopeptide repeat protein [Gammaproteobacteria bacterium]|nr:tetratricopeptide repeat protein [Gammaproteobacteria bacterium]
MNRPDTQNPGQLSDQVKMLSASALALANRGQLTDAERVYRQILAVAPYHASSLSFMASQAYARGETTEALVLMDKAIQGNPRNPLLLQTRAQIYRNLGRLADSTRDLDQAIALHPDLYTARFHRAINLKDAGDWNGAIKQITTLVQQLPELRNWGNDETPPEQLSALALEATNIVRAAQLALIDAELQPLVEIHGKDSLKRVFEGIAHYAGLREKTADTSLQQPRSLYIAGLDEEPVRTGWPAGMSPDLETMRRELAPLLPRSGVAAAEQPETRIRTLWNLSQPRPTTDGAAAPDLGRLLPGIEQAAIILVPGGTHPLQPASDENWRLTAYTLLEGSGPVTLAVGGRREIFDQGGCLLAGHQPDHAIENGGDGSCVVLCFQTWHPDLTQAEREGLEAVQRAFQRFRSKYL